MTAPRKEQLAALLDRTTIPLSVGDSGATGAASLATSVDHVHSHGSHTDPTNHAVSDASNAGFQSSSNFTQVISSPLKLSVKAATKINITLVGAQTVDGINIIAGDRVLVKNQSTGANNGIYIASNGVWARSSDADTSAKFSSGMEIFVEQGTQGKTICKLYTLSNITLNTTSLVFARIDTELNVRAFGGIGDGSADDTAAVLAVVAAAQFAGYVDGIQTAYFPAGSYKVSPNVLKLAASKQVRMVGDGSTKTKIWTSSPGTLLGVDNPQGQVTGGLISGISFESTAAADILATLTPNFLTSTFTATAHGLDNGQWVTFENTGGALPTGISANRAYHIVNKTANDFQIANTVSGTVVTFSDNGTGTNKVRADNIQIDATGCQLTEFHDIGIVNISPRGIGVYMDSRAGGTNINRFSYISGAQSGVNSIACLLTTKYTQLTNSQFLGPNANIFIHWHYQNVDRVFVCDSGQGNVYDSNVTESIVSYHYDFGGSTVSGNEAIENIIQSPYCESFGTSYVVRFQTGAHGNYLNGGGLTSVLGVIDPASITDGRNVVIQRGYIRWGEQVFDRNWATPIVCQLRSSTASATGNTFVVAAQQTTGSNSTGGTLSLESGNGVLAYGHLQLRLGGQTGTDTSSTLYAAGQLALDIYQGAASTYIHHFDWYDSSNHLARSDVFQYNGAVTSTWALNITSVTHSQSDNVTNSATGASLTFKAQNATGTSTIGGALNLTSGTGTSTHGAVNLQVGGTTTFTLSSTSTLSTKPFIFDVALANPKVSQTATSTTSAVGAVLSIIGQRTTGSGSTGGDATLESGNGVAAYGHVKLRLGGSYVASTDTYTVGMTALDVYQDGSFNHHFDWYNQVEHIVRSDTFLHAGATTLIWASGVTSISWSQANTVTNSAVGAALSFTAQNATGTTTTGGAINLTSGTGTTIAGSIVLATGATTKMTVAPGGITLTDNIFFTTAQTTPTIKQNDNTTNSATATSLTIQSANATGTTAVGGALNLTSGTGTSAAGSIVLATGATTKLTIASTGITPTDNISFILTQSSPIINQADNVTNSATGQILKIQAQNATGTTAVGGALNLVSGTGTSTAGNVVIKCGATTAITCTASTATTSVTGALATDTSLDVGAGFITIGSSGLPTTGHIRMQNSKTIVGRTTGAANCFLLLLDSSDTLGVGDTVVKTLVLDTRAWASTNGGLFKLRGNNAIGLSFGMQQGGDQVMTLTNVGVVPTSAPTLSVSLYSHSGALKMWSVNNAVTTVAPVGPISATKTVHDWVDGYGTTASNTPTTTIVQYDLSAFTTATVLVEFMIQGNDVAGNSSISYARGAFKMVNGTCSQVGTTLVESGFPLENVVTGGLTLDNSSTVIRGRITGVSGVLYGWLGTLRLTIFTP